MNGCFELTKLKWSTGGDGGVSIWSVRPTGDYRVASPEDRLRIFPERIFRADRAKDFGGRETA